MTTDLKEAYRASVAGAAAERDAAIAAAADESARAEAIAKFDEWNAGARASRAAALQSAESE